jgi:hypothetical protein
VSTYNQAPPPADWRYTPSAGFFGNTSASSYDALFAPSAPAPTDSGEPTLSELLRVLAEHLGQRQVVFEGENQTAWRKDP